MSTSSSSESRGSETVEQFIGEFFVKAAQAILSSRVYEPPAPGSKERNAKRSAWFKLHLEELESARKPLDRWRLERGVGLPLVLEIYLHPCTTTSTTTPSEDSPGTLIERWCFHYRQSTGLPCAPLSPGGLSRSQMNRLNPQHVYRRLMLLIRSVYSYCRVLPAYKLYRTSYRSPAFHLKYKLHSTLPQRGDAVSAKMQRFEFSTVETADAQLHLAVEYQPASTVKVLGQAAMWLPRPKTVISDYVKDSDRLEKNNNNKVALLEKGKSQGIPVAETAAAVAQGDSLLESAPSAPAALLSGPSGGSTPRRGWSSSFRQFPARIYEPPVYSHQKYPSPGAVSSSPMTEKGAAAVDTSLPERVVRGAAQPVEADISTDASKLPDSSLKNQKEALFLSKNKSTSAHQQPIHGGGGAGSGAPGEEEREEVNQEGRRVSSSPMAIPGTSTAHYKRRPHTFRSSCDLGALDRRQAVDSGEGGGGGGGGDRRNEDGINRGDVATTGNNEWTSREYTSAKPMSAPASSYMHHLAIDDPTRSDDGTDQSHPPAPLLPPPLTVKVSAPSPPKGNLPQSASSSSSYPVPSSPDLPFAFTPSARYHSFSPASVGSGGGGRLLQSLSRPSPTFSSSGGSDVHHYQYGAPTPPLPHPAQLNIVSNSSSPNSNLSGREIPAGTALMRRASWGTRSLYVRDTPAASAGAAALLLGQTPTSAMQIGYSISPIRDTMLESAVLSASIPKNVLYNTNYKAGSDVFFTSSRSTAGGVGGGGGTGVLGEVGSASSKRDPLLLTFPSSPYSEVEPSPGGDALGNRVAVARGAAAAGVRLPREDSEQLPFDFTTENSEDRSHNSDEGVDQGKIWQERRESAEEMNVKEEAAAVGEGKNPAPAFDAQSSAASIGAFMRLINEAQPLSGLDSIPIEVGLHQLNVLKDKLISSSFGSQSQR